jgi:predicted dehydrogenase
MIKALLIGCGNIGAGYDLDDETRVWTHAKAYSMQKDLELFVYDEDRDKSARAAAVYGASQLEEVNEGVLNNFDLLSITTPTTSHFYYLDMAIRTGVPVVICEKPVVGSLEEVKQLEQLYNSGNTKVLVNYMRRFQPAYESAKRKLQELRTEQSLQAVIMKYKRGLLNNASHAIDLLEYFFEAPFLFESFQYSVCNFDTFDYDPTITGSCQYLQAPVSFSGVGGASYGIFEIELFFNHSKIVICHSGNDIKYYYEQEGQLIERSSERQTGILDKYMLPVMSSAFSILQNQEVQDNFISSLRLNRQVLQIIKTLKINPNATISH